MAMRQELGLGEEGYPDLHLSPALRSPKAREALRQPLFSPPTPGGAGGAGGTPGSARRQAGTPASSVGRGGGKDTPGGARVWRAAGATTTTPADDYESDRYGRPRPRPEKLDMKLE